MSAVTALRVADAAAAPPRHDAQAVAARLAEYAANAEACARLLTSSLRAFNDGTATLLDVRVGDAIAGRRGKAFLLIDTRLQETASGEVRPQQFVVQFFADDDGRKVLWRMRRRGMSLANRRYSRYLPAPRILVHEFPFDYRLETLADASSADRVQARLAAMVGDPALRVEQIDVVRYVPEKRCLLRYRVITRGQPCTWLGKVYVHDDDLVSGAVQAALARTPGGGMPPRVPAIVGMLLDLRLVVQECIDDGTPLYESLRAGAMTGAHLAGTARALAGLHAGALHLVKHHAWHDELDIARSAVERSALDATRRLRARRIVARLATERVERSADEVPVHRDFYDKQVLLTPDGVTLIDFDTIALSYRELDVANFVAHLLLRSMQGYVSRHLAVEHAAAFLDAYVAASPAFDVQRFRLTLATTWLRLAAVYAVRPLWAHLSPALVEVARRTSRESSAQPSQLLVERLFRAGGRR